MKTALHPLRWLRIAVCCLSASSVSYTLLGQSVTTTVPVGFIKVVVPAATAIDSPGMTLLSIPFDPAAVQAGKVGAVGTNSIAVANASWSKDQFATGGYLLRVKSGTSVGRYFPITGNTQSTATLESRGYSLQTATPTAGTQLQIQVGDLVEIVPAQTIGRVFGTRNTPLLTGASAGLADNVMIYTNGEWVTYFPDGKNWKRTGSSQDQSATIIAPEAPVFVVRRADSALELILAGTVPSTPEVIDLPAGAARPLAQRFPKDLTLGNLGLSHLGSGASASAADVVQIWNGRTWDEFYFNGTHWRRAGSFADQESFALPAGTGVFIQRRTSGGALTFILNLPYTL